MSPGPNFDTDERWHDVAAPATRARMAAYRYDPAFLEATDLALNQLGGYHDVLEVGPGAGVEATRLSLAGARLVGLDLTAELRRDGPWELVLGNAEQMPFCEASFDGVFLNRIIHHLPEPPRVLGELARILRARGVAVLVWPDWHETRCSSDHAEALVAAQTTPGLGCASPLSRWELAGLAREQGLTPVFARHISDRYFGADALRYAFGHLIASDEKRAFLAEHRPGVLWHLDELHEELALDQGWIDLSLCVCVLEHTSAPLALSERDES